MKFMLRRIAIEDASTGQFFHRPMWIFVTAFLLRTAVMATFFVHSQFTWGVNESAGIARSIVEGHGFSSAFHDADGPTAWLAPVYPGLIAAIFRFLGIESVASAGVAVLFNVIFSSLTAVLLVRLGREQLGETAGVVAGWCWAIAPPLLVMPWLPWETCLSALVLTFAFLTTLKLRSSSRLADWIRCGMIWSFAALLNPAMLAPLAVLSAEAALHTRRLKGPAVMIGVCVLGILPWTVRNYRAFRCVVPIRSNFWPEAYFGNVGFSLHPTGGAMLYQKEGEIAFSRDLKKRTLNFVRSNPREFTRLVAHRIAAFWGRSSALQPCPVVVLGLSLGGIAMAWWQRKRWLAFASVLAVYPVVYYVTYVFARYRYPIEPLMYGLSAYLVVALFSGLHKCDAEQSLRT
jgi:hypothetical protein